ncbi:hypothetical protein BCR42DRAFT_434187 [Absidia repens]|uniref:Uncharacterized protein n=1 Tax=Absidia repens TaxID=90262 RepID=A0A1X2IRZ6_9FUNG|nr:hypothetical protein BCR42DRAFT_434187 [Absidia repens]
MDSTWTMTLEQQTAYIEAMTVHHFAAYRRDKRRLINNLLQDTGNRRSVNTIIKKLANADRWDQADGAAFTMDGHVDNGLDLANLFGLGDLMAWATSD